MPNRMTTSASLMTNSAFRNTAASAVRVDDLRFWTPSFVQLTRAETALASNVFGYLTTIVARLPKFELRWFRPQHPMDEHFLRDLHGRTFPFHEPPVVMILVGLDPAELVRVTVHEAKHVLDAPAARAGMSTAELEARARNFEAQWTPSLLRKLGLATRAPSVGAAPDVHPLWVSHVVYR